MFLEAVALTTCEVAADGQTVRLNLLDPQGHAVAVVLPLACVTSLMMTLPALQTQALRAAHADPSLRVAYPAERWSLERSADAHCLLLTLTTPDGFQVCFSLHPDAIADMAHTACGEARSSRAACQCALSSGRRRGSRRSVAGAHDHVGSFDSPRTRPDLTLSRRS
jgi:hypothetical protein